MKKNNDIGSLVRVFNAYRLLIVLCGVVFAAVGLFKSLTSPRLYQCDAVISLPEIGDKIVSTDAKGTVYGLVNVSETRAMLDLSWDRGYKKGEADISSDTLMKRLQRVRVSDIQGSNTFFKMSVQVYNNPQSSPAIMDRLIEYLNNNQYVKNRYEMERRELEKNVQDLQLTLDQAVNDKNEAIKLLKLRNPVGFNPVELESKVMEVKKQYNSAVKRLSLVHNYQYVDRPYVKKNPVS
ncbi:MAG: hypothetical protein Q7U71_07695, partial [bacterium]|nr:hypothetical protein [bacterium]